MNPPYSPMNPWLKKTQEEARNGAKIVTLTPPLVCKGLFAQYLPSEINLIVGRIDFLHGGKTIKGNRFDSMVCIYEKKTTTPKVKWIKRDEILKRITLEQ